MDNLTLTDIHQFADADSIQLRFPDYDPKCGIVKVSWACKGVQFEGQFDPDNRGVYGVNAINPSHALRVLETAQPVDCDPDGE